MALITVYHPDGTIANVETFQLDEFQLAGFTKEKPKDWKPKPAPKTDAPK